MTVDAWGASVAADEGSTIDAWNAAWEDALHFVGDPFAKLADANETDHAFALGSVFCGAYRILGGASPDSDEVVADLQRAISRADTPRDLGHVEALVLLVEGNFTRAALRWDEVSADQRDFAAVRFAHDVYLHVGNVDDRLRSSSRAVDAFGDDVGWSLVLSQHAFSLEEAGQLDEAERAALTALEHDPLDLWALHALAHVYETANDQSAAIDLLRSREATWSTQESLSMHIWWHLTLRLIEGGEFDEVLDIHDRMVPSATTPFRLCDLISMLWRLELAGVDVGDRWDHLADSLVERPERHTSGFLDMHTALVYSRRPHHEAAQGFFANSEVAHGDGTSENSENFRSVVRPLVHAIKTADAQPAVALATLEKLDDQLFRIGGSIAQRDLIPKTRTFLANRMMEST